MCEILQVAAQALCNLSNSFEVFRREGVDEEPADEPEMRRIGIPAGEGASDVGKRTRGGTRVAFQPLPPLGSPESTGNPAQSDRFISQSEAKSVDVVHTFVRPLSAPSMLAGGTSERSLRGNCSLLNSSHG
jgi:hypothetical protein